MSNNQIKKILESIILSKKEAGKGKSSKVLYKMRYGDQWKNFYPSN